MLGDDWPMMIGSRETLTPLAAYMQSEEVPQLITLSQRIKIPSSKTSYKELDVIGVALVLHR